MRANLKALAPKPVKGLSELSLKGIADYIKSGHAKNVIIMQGAGISTAAGIPDFRTPGTGLYYQLEKYNLPYPEAIFDIDYFPEHPQAFFTLCKELLPGNFRPTIGHYLAPLLHKKGILKRVFTQNIDGLERLAGLPDDKIIEAHGHFYTAHCLECRRKYNLDDVKDELKEGKVVICKKEGCNGLVKPDIVFFGEDLPEEYHKKSRSDFPKCDLLIVIGTGLAVYPFAGLIGYVNDDVPRLLVNMEPVQTYKEVLEVKDNKLIDKKARREYPKFKFDHLTNVRDVFAGGDCQKSIVTLIDALGWTRDLMEMLPEPLKTKAADLLEAEPETEPEV